MEAWRGRTNGQRPPGGWSVAALAMLVALLVSACPAPPEPEPGPPSAGAVPPSAPSSPAPSPGWPIGIPAPSFGIAEALPPSPSPWTAPVANTYFVCPSCVGATDVSNPQGYPGKARRTIPNPLNGPALVVLHGQINNDVSFTGNGTAAEPIFVTSYDPAAPALLTVQTEPQGGYIIFDNLWFGAMNEADDDFGLGIREGSHHIAVRNSLFTGNKTRSGGIGLGTWSYAGAQSVSHIVIDHNTIRFIGDTAATVDQDAHCITINGSADNIWVTFNTLNLCSGDALQIEAQSGRRAFIHHVYYGKNLASFNRQTGGWVKNATDVIFSQNVAHDFRSNSGGSGACYGFQYDAEYVWFIYNEAYACNIGINIAGADVSPGSFAAIIGNVIRDQAGETPNDPYNGGAIIVRGGTNVHVVNNTLANVDAGVNMPPGTNSVTIQNNIIVTNGAALYAEDTATRTISNNLYSPAAVFVGVAKGSNAITANPLFASASDFHLQSTSPAIDAGLQTSVYATFLARYGISIAVDKDANARPAGAAWDLGAFEAR